MRFHKEFPAVLLVLGLLLGSPAGSAFQEEKDKKDRDKKKEETPKIFQLENIVIDVVERMRDIEYPNMTVVKTEFFPQSLATTLDTALERQPGVDVQRIQEIGTAVDDDSIKVRGMGARRIKVMKNGRLMNTSGVAGGYFIDWTMLPLADIDRVEVIKGVGDPRTGNVLGGVINLVPRRLPTDKPLTEVQLSTASYSTYGINLFHGYKPGAIEYALSLGTSAGDGYLKNGDTGFTSVGIHAGIDFSFRGRVTFDLGYSKIRKGFIVGNRLSGDPDEPLFQSPMDSAFRASDGEYMYGGMGAYAEPGSHWIKTKWIADLGYEQAIGKSGVLSFRVWRNHGDREAYNTWTALNRVFHKMFYDDRSRGASAYYRQGFGTHILTLGMDIAHLKDDGDANTGSDFRAPFRNGFYVSAKNLDAYAMADLNFDRDRLTVTPGIRYQSYEGISGPAGILERIPDIAMNGWAPSLKLTYRPNDERTLYLSLARALRMPTPPEHYWHYDDDDAGVDTSMLPFHEEDGLMIQGGFKSRIGPSTRIEIAPYYYAISNYIQFDLINFVSYNIDRAAIAGIELEAAHRFGHGLSAFANYTYQKSRTEGDPFIAGFVIAEDASFDEIPGLPAHKANLGIQYAVRGRAQIAAFVQLVSGQKIVYSNNRLWNTALRILDQKGFARFDIEARYPFSPLVSLGIFVRNILNARYEERFGFPAAGRTAGLSLKVGI